MVVPFPESRRAAETNWRFVAYLLELSGKGTTTPTARGQLDLARARDGVKKLVASTKRPNRAEACVETLQVKKLLAGSYVGRGGVGCPSSKAQAGTPRSFYSIQLRDGFEGGAPDPSPLYADSSLSSFSIPLMS